MCQAWEQAFKKTNDRAPDTESYDDDPEDSARAGWDYLASRLDAIRRSDLNRVGMGRAMYSTFHEGQDIFGRTLSFGTPVDEYFAKHPDWAKSWLMLADMLVRGELV